MRTRKFRRAVVLACLSLAASGADCSEAERDLSIYVMGHTSPWLVDTAVVDLGVNITSEVNSDIPGCSAEGFSMTWSNGATGARAQGLVWASVTCFPGLGCSCNKSGDAKIDLVVGENPVSITVADPHGHQASTSIVVVRNL